LRDSAVYLAEFYTRNASYASFASDVDRAAARSNAAALRRSGVVAPYIPLFLAARLAYPSDGALYASLVDLAERYTARVFIIQQKRNNTGGSALRRLAYKLHGGTPPSDILDEMRSLVWQYAPDNRVTQTMESTEEDWYHRRGHKFLLYEYERSVQRANQEELKPLSWFTQGARSDRTTEHILPQEPAEDANCWWDVFTRDEHLKLRHALGNLVLTYDNSSYGRKCFSEKKGHPFVAGEDPIACYAQGKLRQEQFIAGFPDWTPDTIQTRQVTLAAWALKRWSVPMSGTAQALDTELEIEGEGTAEDLAALTDSDSS
jgi:hypothetical protein